MRHARMGPMLSFWQSARHASVPGKIPAIDAKSFAADEIFIESRQTEFAQQRAIVDARIRCTFKSLTIGTQEAA